METKQEFRREVSKRRKALETERAVKMSEEITKKVISLKEYKESSLIFVYIDYNNEVQTGMIMEKAWKDGKQVAAPKVNGKEMDFYLLNSKDDLESGYMGIMEPKEGLKKTDAKSGMMVMPGVAFDRELHRVGYGGGFYDRFLETHPGIKKVAVAYELQLFDEVPHEEFDLSPDLLVTETAIYRPQAPAQEPARQEYFIGLLRQWVSEQEEKLGRKLTACVQTFGCQMNAKDSEKLSGILSQAGYVLSESEASDFVLYNTCTVRDNANQRVYGRLGYLNSLKQKNSSMIIALCGCMMQEQTVIHKIRKSYRFVDLIFGTHNVYKLAELLCERVMNRSRMVVDVWEKADGIVEELPAERKYAFKSGVNIMYGCNNFCSYCIVPYVRGRERSRKPEEIISEIKRLVDDGVIEVMLLGQNVNSYGKTLESPMTFAELLTEVEKIEGLERIRFMTSHPKDLSDELIKVMKNSKKICRHLHLPLQSGSSRILKIMNRRYDKEGYLALVDKLKREIPDLSLTTDIIVGFPGETEEDFMETMDVVEKVRYDSAFTFIYSKRTGTPAAAMEQVPEDVTHERFDRLLTKVQEISAQVCGKDTGKVMAALVEGLDEKEEGMVTGRLSNNIMVHFAGDESLVGTICNVRLDESRGFYYMGTRIE